MRVSRWPAGRLLMCLCLALVTVSVSARPGAAGPAAQEPAKAQPKVAAAELTAAQKVEAAADEAARLAAAGEFLKKYPKSALRPQVAQFVASKISVTTDPAQLITLTESFRTVFNQPGEADILNPSLLSAYIKANRVDDAFKLASAALDKMPNPVGAMLELVVVANNEVRQQHPQFVAPGAQYAGRAIELIEADKKPAAVDDAAWADYKTKWLPQLYQLQGFLLLVGGDAAGATTRLTKAMALNPTEPQNYWILGRMRDNEYQDLATKYKAASGAAQADIFKQALAVLDQVVDDYAHVVALSEGQPQFQAMHDQTLQDLQSYYKYRHNGSADGLKELIEKYKQPAAPKP